ncbi:MAG: hypothetical protein U5Q44_08370 [Dehalococcoidia bacterium]|nr:hypothetical protein [Dehalococcoidia bacterium]
MTRFLVLPLALFALCAIAVQQPSAASAQDGGVEFESSVDNGYPTELTFNLRATAGTEITDVTLRYSIVGQNASGIGKPDDYQPSDNIDVAIDVEVNQGNNFIPVSSQFRYSWDIDHGDGELVTTPEENYLYMPPDRDWQSVEDEIMRVYYHGQRESTARDFLEAGQETYQRMAVELFQVELPVTPVNVVLFATESDMDPGPRRPRWELRRRR